jgi:hypothetical protein
LLRSQFFCIVEPGKGIKAAMSLHVRPETEARINALAAASGVSVDDYLAALVERESPSDETARPSHELPVSGRRRPIWEVIVENMKDVPPEDFSALPEDGLSQIDHYVYGVPKRTP